MLGHNLPVKSWFDSGRADNVCRTRKNLPLIPRFHSVRGTWTKLETVWHFNPTRSGETRDLGGRGNHCVVDRFCWLGWEGIPKRCMDLVPELSSRTVECTHGINCDATFHKTYDLRSLTTGVYVTAD